MYLKKIFIDTSLELKSYLLKSYKNQIKNKTNGNYITKTLALFFSKRQQFDQKITPQHTDFRMFTDHFCMDSCQHCMDEPMMQNAFIDQKEAPQRVSAK